MTWSSPPARSAMRGQPGSVPPIEFPAVPDYEGALGPGGHRQGPGPSLARGVVQCKDSFYGQHAPGRMPVSYELEAKVGGPGSAWGVLASEMESAALFTRRRGPGGPLRLGVST